MLKFILDLLARLFSRGGKKALPTAKKETQPPKLADSEAKKVQKKLIHLNAEFDGGADGDIGPKTMAAVEDFKLDNEIEEDGLGPETLAALDAAHAALGLPEGLPLEVGDQGSEVADLQKKLMALGHDMPRFGADGSLGDETLVAVKTFQREEGIEDEDAFKDQGVGPKTLKAITAAEVKDKPVFVPPPPATGKIPFDPPEGMIVTKHLHDLKKGDPKRPLKLSQIRGVTIHQTACQIGDKERRYDNVACHVAITQSGKIIWVNDFERYVWHGHGFNKYTLGIELDGHFAGLESLNEETGEWEPDLDTYWRPKSRPDRMPLSITPAQAEACKQVIRWMKRYIDGNGGNFDHIVAHRQSSGSRISDPGEKTWKLVALPLFDELGMTEGGPDYFLADRKGRAARPLPKEWGPDRYTASYRRTPKVKKGHPTGGPK